MKSVCLYNVIPLLFFLCASPSVASVGPLSSSSSGSEDALKFDSIKAGERIDSIEYHDLEEISITAVKQESRFRNMAVAGTALTAPELEHLNVFSIKGISDVVPNFYIPDYGSRVTSSIYVRGIGARMDQPSVGLNIDNIPILYKDAYDFDINDIVNVEMLRGPQSTLFGRNTMGGLINVTTLSPLRYQGWRLVVQSGSAASFKGSAGWYHKFHRNFGFAATASFSATSGFFKNEYNGKKVDRERMFNFRVKTDWNVTDCWKLNNVVNLGLLRQGGYPYAFKDTGVISYNDTCFYHRVTVSDGFSAKYTGEKFSVTSVSSYQYINDNLTLDQDFLPEDYFTLSQIKHEIGLTEDIVVKGLKSDSPYSWLIGLFAFYKHMNMNAPVTFKDMGISKLIEENRNESNPDYPIKWNTRQFPLNSNFKIPTWGMGLYHESKLDLGKWHLTAALRLDYEHSRMKYHSRCETGYTIYEYMESGDRIPYHDVVIDINDYGSESRHYLTLLPKVTALYDVSQYINIYANVAKGYKSGGFNTQMFSDVLQQRLMNIMGIGNRYNVDEIVGYRPENSWNFEVGSHLAFLDGRITLDAALFYIYCIDQQLTVFPDGTTTGRIMTNAGKTRSFGGEVSVCAEPVERLILRADYGYTNARFLKFNNGISDFKGKYLPYVPQNTLFLEAMYTFPNVTSWLSGLTFAVNTRGTGRIFWNEDNTEKQNMYFLTGASATFTGSKGELQIWARNMMGTEYDTFYFVSMGNAFFQKGRSREMGITLRLNF